MALSSIPDVSRLLEPCTGLPRALLTLLDRHGFPLKGEADLRKNSDRLSLCAGTASDIDTEWMAARLADGDLDLASVALMQGFRYECTAVWGIHMSPLAWCACRSPSALPLVLRAAQVAGA